MKRSIVETLLGAVVIVIALVFLVYSMRKAEVRAVNTGYEIVADFSGIGGLKSGDDVEISGVKIGTVSAVSLNPETYLARVAMTIDSDIKLPDDTAAMISSQSLLGGRYLALEPGGSDINLAPGGRIQYTQAPQNLEQLLGQFIFSMQSEKKEGKDDASQKAGNTEAAPAAEEMAHP